MPKRVYTTSAWRSARRRVLERDGWRCQVKLPGCLGRANAADHIIERFEGGADFDLENLQATCKPCNSKKHMDVLARRAKVRLRAW